MSENKVVLDGDEMRRTLVRIAHEIVERHEGPDGLAVIGIHRRGAVLAERLHALLCDLLDADVPLGFVDISFYRDDLAQRTDTPLVHATTIDFAVDGATVVIVDDVLYTGRTVRAAIEALFAYGRPAKVQLAVLADRGHRELPIRPDYVGKNLPTARAERVNVRVSEIDGVDEVTIASDVAEARSPGAGRGHVAGAGSPGAGRGDVAGAGSPGAGRGDVAGAGSPGAGETENPA